MVTVALVARGAAQGADDVVVDGSGELVAVVGARAPESVTARAWRRRCGGQGDVTAGAVGAFLAWASTYGAPRTRWPTRWRPRPLKRSASAASDRP